MDSIERTKSNLEALIRESEIEKARAVKAAAKELKKQQKSKPETNAMTDLKESLWDRFMNPYAKYGL